jgi:hypothetical protein
VDIVLGKGDGDVGRFIHKDGGGGGVVWYRLYMYRTVQSLHTSI